MIQNNPVDIKYYKIEFHIARYLRSYYDQMMFIEQDHMKLVKRFNKEL